MNILSWILFGLLVGVAANIIDPSKARGGLLGSIVLGILGALLGGFLGDLLFGIGISGFNLSSFILAVAGSLILLFIGKAYLKGGRY